MKIVGNRVPIDCKHCNGTGRTGEQDNRHWCLFCGTMGYDWFDLSALMTLAHNLAIDAALQRAFELGGDRARWVSGYFEGWYGDTDDTPWAPGEGAPAPDSSAGMPRRAPAW